MSRQESIDFDAPPRTRSSGHETSELGHADIKMREGSQRWKLLRSYADMRDATDDEAAALAGLMHTCYWKRCGELRAAGYIAVIMLDDYDDYEAIEATRMGLAGVQRILCRITKKGIAALGLKL